MLEALKLLLAFLVGLLFASAISAKHANDRMRRLLEWLVALRPDQPAPEPPEFQHRRLNRVVEEMAAVIERFRDHYQAHS